MTLHMYSTDMLVAPNTNPIFKCLPKLLATAYAGYPTFAYKVWPLDCPC